MNGSNRMSYSIVKVPPKGQSNYIKATPKSLLDLLQGGVNSAVITGPIGLFEKALELARLRGYRVSMMPCKDPAGPGGMMTMVGTLYFHVPAKTEPKAGSLK